MQELKVRHLLNRASIQSPKVACKELLETYDTGSSCLDLYFAVYVILFALGLFPSFETDKIHNFASANACTVY